MSNSWDNHLNIKYLNLIFSSIKSDKEAWDQAWEYCYPRCKSMNNVTRAAWIEGFGVLHHRDIGNEFNIIRSEFHGTYSNLTTNRARYIAEYALMALTIYDCGYMIDSDPGELKILSKLGSNAATLMIPTAYAFKLIREKTNV